MRAAEYPYSLKEEALTGVGEQALIHWYLLSDGRTVKRLWLGRVGSFTVLGALQVEGRAT